MDCTNYELSYSSLPNSVVMEKPFPHITCGVCFKPYNDPRMLSCLHSFCLQCLHHEIEKSGSQQMFQCPICERNTSIPLGGASVLPQNLHLGFEVEVAGYTSKMVNNSEVCCDECVDTHTCTLKLNLSSIYSYWITIALVSKNSIRTFYVAENSIRFSLARFFVFRLCSLQTEPSGHSYAVLHNCSLAFIMCLDSYTAILALVLRRETGCAGALVKRLTDREN